MSIYLILSAVLIGLSLGVFGSGGAIITLPTLIYFVGLDEKQAIIGSLFVVLMISSVSLIPQLRSKTVSFSHLYYFALPGIITSYLGAFLGGKVPAMLQLTSFVLLIILAATKILVMKEVKPSHSNSIKQLLLAGAAVGFATGFVGVGGGFLIVPALIFYGGLTIGSASATSLAIISVQSLVGTVSYLQHSKELAEGMPWDILIFISAIGLCGSLLGLKVRHMISEEKLTKVLGWFLIAMALFIVIDKFIFN